MKNRFLFLAMCSIAMAAIARAQVAPHTAMANAKGVKKAWTPPRASDGHPDLQGFWANNNATPLERPKELADHPVLTDDEVQAMRKKADEMFVSGKVDAAFGDQIFLTTWANVKGVKIGFKSTDGETGDYGSEWNDHRVWDNRTSLITDPPDGRMPPLTPEALKRRQESFAAMTRPARGPEDRSLSERCLTYGSPQVPATKIIPRSYRRPSRS